MGSLTVRPTKADSSKSTMMLVPPENTAEMIKENSELLNGLKQIEKDDSSTSTSLKEDKPQDESKTGETTFKRASKTKKTLKVVMEKFKRSPSILFTGPMENVFNFEVHCFFDHWVTQRDKEKNNGRK